MLCPHCNTSLKYKERSNQTCSSCYKPFAFEPKTHPLRLSDNYFKNAVNRLSNYDKLYFTPQQLQFAVSRKKMKSGGLYVTLIILGIISVVITAFIYFPIAIALLIFWTVLIVCLKLFYKPRISLPQSPNEFENTVLADWRRLYQKNPPKLVINHPVQAGFDDLKGILICQSNDAAMCLSANQVDKNLGLMIVLRPHKATEMRQKRGKLPVFVLHDASIDGIEFLEKVRKHFNNQAPVIDIGLQPRVAMKSNFPKLRENDFNANHLGSLTAEERNWLNQGFYVPLYVLRPEKLIQYVTKQIDRRSKPKTIDNPEKQAQAIGFMTWAGQK